MYEISNTDDFITIAVNKYSDTIYRVAFNITQNRDDAFDVCQDVFVRLIKNKHKIKNDEHLKAWLLKTAVNCAKSNCTQAYKRHYADINEVVDFTESENSSSVIDSVMMLPEKYRTAIHLYYYDDLDISQIAKILSITQSGVKSRLLRGRKLLKQIIEKENFYE